MSGVAPDVHEEEPATPAPLFRDAMLDYARQHK